MPFASHRGQHVHYTSKATARLPCSSTGCSSTPRTGSRLASSTVPRSLRGLPGPWPERQARRAGGEMTFDLFIAVAGPTAPALVEWVTNEVEPGIRAC